MKMRLLTALVAASCFSQIAVAGRVTTGSIVDKTITNATVTLIQPITLENTLTPVAGLKAGTPTPTLAIGLIANGNLKIKETGGTAHLALRISSAANGDFVTYANGHENDDDYKLAYRVYPTPTETDSIEQSDGTYIFTHNNANNYPYTVSAVAAKLPKAGSYIISVTGAVYNP